MNENEACARMCQAKCMIAGVPIYRSAEHCSAGYVGFKHLRDQTPHPAI